MLPPTATAAGVAASHDPDGKTAVRGCPGGWNRPAPGPGVLITSVATGTKVADWVA